MKIPWQCHCQCLQKEDWHKLRCHLILAEHTRNTIGFIKTRHNQKKNHLLNYIRTESSNEQPIQNLEDTLGYGLLFTQKVATKSPYNKMGYGLPWESSHKIPIKPLNFRVFFVDPSVFPQAWHLLHPDRCYEQNNKNHDRDSHWENIFSSGLKC